MSICTINDVVGLASSNQRRFARTSDGTLYLAYVTTNASGEARVYVRSSSDGGGSWSAATMVSADYTSSSCALVADSRDDLHVVYVGLGSGYSTNQVWYAWRKEGTWQTPVRISSAAGMESYGHSVPALAVDAADDLHVVWFGMATGYSSYQQIWWAACNQGVWQTPIRISTAAGMDSYDQSFPTLCADGALGLQVAWNGKATGYTTVNQVWFREYLEGSWQSPVRISSYSGMDGNAQGCPNIALGSDGHVHVTWYGYATGYTSYLQIWYAERTTSWQTPVRISTAGGMDTNTHRYPQIAVDSSGGVHVMWEGSSTSYTNQVFRTIRSGGSWGTPTAETTTSENRRANLRWAPFHNREGNLDWVVAQGRSVSYASGGDSDQSVTSVNRKSQSFKALESRRVSYVQLYLKNDATSRTATCAIYAADANGKPTGAVLGSTTATVGSSSYGWITFYFTATTVNLTANSSYCLVCYPSAGTIYWYVDASSPTYTDGNWAYSADSGGSWTADTSKDGYFWMYPFLELVFDNDTTVSPEDVAVMSVTNNFYDDAGRPVAVADALGNRVTTVYDAVGRVSARVDQFGYRTTSVYDAAGRQTAVINALNYRTTTVYDNAGRVLANVDALNNRITYGYDAAGRQQTVQDQRGYVSTTAYDNAGQVSASVDQLGYRTTFTYDGAGRQTATLDPLNQRSTTVYNAVGWVTAEVSPLNERTSFSYDNAGNQRAITNPLGYLTTFSYDAAGRQTEVLDANGNRSTTVYDAAGRTVASVNSLGRRTTSVYEASGELLATVDALGNRTSFVYDAAGRQVATQDALGNLTSTVFDDAGRVQASVDGLGNRTTFVYDELGRQMAAVNPLGKRTTQAYDEVGRLKVSKDPLNHWSTYAYDAAGHQTAVTDAEGRITSYGHDERGAQQYTLDARGYRTTISYDEVGRRRALLDARGNRTSYSYDANGGVTAQTDQLGRAITYGYDAAGQRTSRLDANGGIVTYVYGNVGELLRKQYSDGTRVTMTYDAAGSRLTVADGTGTTTYTYDELDRLKAAKDANAKAVTHIYDAAGNRCALTDPDGGRTTYAYDAARELTSLINPQNERTTFVYDAAGRQITQRNANGAWVSATYDDAGRLTRVVNLKSDNTTISSFIYTLDNVGNRSAVVESNGDRVTWSYDASYQLTRERRSGTNAYDVTYTYDAAGNRATKRDAGTITTYSYDAANQLSYEYTPSARTTYTYDSNGNTTLINAAGSFTTHTWDLENHITKTQLSAGTINTMTYDGDGVRRRMEDSAGVRNFVWDQQNLLLETDDSNNTSVAYTMAPRGYGALVSQRRSGSTYLHLFDALGSTDRLTDSSQNTVISYLYRAFGEQTVLSGSSANALTWVGQLGYYRQADASTYWLRARVYQPSVGRFLSYDPLMNEADLYLYVRNRAVLLVDPSGLEEIANQCAWIREDEHIYPKGHWCCDCGGGSRTTRSCVLYPPAWPERPGPQDAPRDTKDPLRMMMGHNVRCDHDAGGSCLVDFALSHAGRHPRTVKINIPGSVVEHGGGGAGGSCGGGGGGAGDPCRAVQSGNSFAVADRGVRVGPLAAGAPPKPKGLVLVWIGDLGWWGNGSGILNRAEHHVDKLRERGYQTAKKVGRTWDELRDYQRRPCLQGLFAAAHGRCEKPDKKPPDTGCRMDTLGGPAYYVAPIPRPPHVRNDWAPLVKPSRDHQVYIYHCMNPRYTALLDQKDVQNEVKTWYDRRLRASVEVCDIDSTTNTGKCMPPKVLAALDVFLSKFP